MNIACIGRGCRAGGQVLQSLNQVLLQMSSIQSRLRIVPSRWKQNLHKNSKRPSGFVVPGTSSAIRLGSNLECVNCKVSSASVAKWKNVQCARRSESRPII